MVLTMLTKLKRRGNHQITSEIRFEKIPHEFIVKCISNLGTERTSLQDHSWFKG